MSGRVVALSDYRGTPRLRSAVEAFFSDKQLSANTRRGYSQALQAIAEELGGTSPLTNSAPESCSMPFRSVGGRRSPLLGTPG